MSKIGVIGAGVMGTGVAQCFAQEGIEVVLIDVSEEILKLAKEKMYNDIRFQNLFQKSNKIININEIMERVTFTVDYNLLEEVDFIVENTTEDLGVKSEVYKKIKDVYKDDVIILANTSCILITQLASFTRNPENVIGVHFMNPVPLKDTVEVIKGYHTSDRTIEKTKEVLKLINKETIIVNDFPGFVSNRISHLLMNEAAFVVQDNVATPESVDNIFKKCYGHKMGPLETADLIGLDTVVNSLDILYESYKDSKFRCCPLLRKMVSANLLGRKSKEGFYKYKI